VLVYDGPMKLLVTGGAGFIGSCFIRFFLKKNQDVAITNLDALTYAGCKFTCDDVKDHPRYTFVQGNICDRDLVDRVIQEGQFDAVLNFAAESHVDRSIVSPEQFVLTNVLGTQNLLESSRKYEVPKYVQISTDEVYGTLGDKGEFTEKSPLEPSSPYSASKASADLLCLAYYKTFDFPVVITRSINVYGPYQYPEKLIPVLIEKAENNRPLPLYGNGLNVRSWIYVEDNCEAIWSVLQKGKLGEVYNISTGVEQTNLDIAKTILKIMGKNESLIEFVKDRPGHDWRYALSASKLMNELGWQSQTNFENGIQNTVKWYQENQAWVKEVLKKVKKQNPIL